MPAHFDSTAVGEPLREPVRSELLIRTAAAALGLGAVALAVLTSTGESAPTTAARVIGVALPVSFGLFRLAHDRRDRFALLLLSAGAMWSLTTLAGSSGSTAYSVGRVSVWLVEPALVLLILAFPHGRLESVVDRRLAAAVGTVVAVLYLPTALLAPFPEPSPWTTCGTDCPSNAFLVSSHTAGAVDGFVRPLREVLAVVLFAAVTAAIAQRARRSGPIGLRILLPVAVMASLRTLGLAVYFITRRSGQTSDLAEALGWVYWYSLPLLTLAFMGGLVARRVFVADALERIAQSVASRPSAHELRRTLSEALRDPALELRFAVPKSPSGWVEETGWPAARPAAGPGRAVTEATVDGRQVAAIVHDRELVEDPKLLAAVVSQVVAALENRQLVGQLRASLDELSKSRARLVSVADEERRRIERDLHDGAQQRLVALQIKLELLAERLDVESPANAVRARALEDEIASTLDEIRRFGRGVYPPLLADRGLADALHAVARSAALPTTVDVHLSHRYPREVEAAVYFACLEAIQNATKHARGATGIRIAVSGNGRLRFDVRDNGAGFDTESTSPGAGLTNLRDRVAALGGQLEIRSEPGRGTRVTGTVPVE